MEFLHSIVGNGVWSNSSGGNLEINFGGLILEQRSPKFEMMVDLATFPMHYRHLVLVCVWLRIKLYY